MRAVRFINHNINPDTTQREISFSVIDPTGLTSNTLTSLTSVSRANDYVVTAAGGAYYINGNIRQGLNMVRGSTYKFDLSSNTLGTSIKIF